jgi:hypothetical protein
MLSNAPDVQVLANIITSYSKLCLANVETDFAYRALFPGDNAEQPYDGANRPLHVLPKACYAEVYSSSAK